MSCQSVRINPTFAVPSPSALTAAPPAATSNPTPPRIRPTARRQFSVRELFYLMTAVAVILGLLFALLRR
jgi:hypothetical protein